MSQLPLQLQRQLDWKAFDVRVNGGHLRYDRDFYSIPDVAVIPRELWPMLPEEPGNLESYDAPLPLVVEVWSPSTGSYDVGEKLAGYQARGDQEIWRIHPFERTLTAWRRYPDGTCTETVYQGGTVEPASLPGVAIDLETLLG